MASYFSIGRQPLVVLSIATLVVLVAMLLNSTSLSPFILFSSQLSDPYPIVTNSRTGVTYRGITVNGIEHFQNIFYAEDTSGANRFAPPVPYNPPRGTTVDATAAGAWCPQFVGGAPLPFTSPITNVSEHCLSLRIARSSAASASAKLPVLVYIHGGTSCPCSGGQMFLADSIVRR